MLYEVITEQLSGFLSVKAIAALYFPCYLTSRSQMKALQKKLNENSTLIQKLNNTGFTVNSTRITSYNVCYTKLLR